MDIILLILLIILFVILATFAIGGILAAPYLPTLPKQRKHIISLIDLKKGNIVYDLGCGDARVLTEAAKASKSSETSESSKSRFVGIERVWFPLVLARFRVLKNKKKDQVKIYNKDFFETDLSNATHVFLYLSSKIMDKLLPKLERELKPGARVVSCSFKFSNKKEKEIINLNRNENQLARELYVYEF